MEDDAQKVKNRQLANTDQESLQGYFEWVKQVQSAHRQFAKPLPADGDYPTSVEFIDKDFIWKLYQSHVDLYKHYLDLVIKFNVFYYAITGAFLSYYFTNAGNDWVRWALVFPVVMSLFFSGLFFVSARAVKYMNEEIQNISLMFGFTQPKIDILKYALVISSVLFGLISVGLIILFLVKT